MVRVLIFVVVFLIAISDIRKMIIPNTLTLILFLLALIFRGRNIYNIENGILGMGTYVLPFLIVYGYVSDVIKKDAIGFGDIKLMLSLGYILGYSNLLNIYHFFLLTFILASIVGVIIGIVHKSWDFKLPFSPFLILIFLYFWWFN